MYSIRARLRAAVHCDMRVCTVCSQVVYHEHKHCSGLLSCPHSRASSVRHHTGRKRCIVYPSWLALACSILSRSSHTRRHWEQHVHTRAAVAVLRAALVAHWVALVTQVAVAAQAVRLVATMEESKVDRQAAQRVAAPVAVRQEGV